MLLLIWAAVDVSVENVGQLEAAHGDPEVDYGNDTPALSPVVLSLVTLLLGWAVRVFRR